MRSNATHARATNHAPRLESECYSCTSLLKLRSWLTLYCLLLKPANIFLTTDGTIKVGDLGLSREMSDETMQAYSKVGTPLYMSPEVLKGDGYDFKSDIWSLGCLLYEASVHAHTIDDLLPD